MSPVGLAGVASRALERVQAVPVVQQADYRSMVLSLPALIQREGLAAALHFVAARGEAGQRLVLLHLAEEVSGKSTRGLLDAVVRSTPSDATRLTGRVMRTLVWHRRFVKVAWTTRDQADVKESP